jgi:xylose isomerase
LHLLFDEALPKQSVFTMLGVSSHQYDFDVETVAGFLRHYGPEKEFPMSYYETTLAMLSILKIGGSTYRSLDCRQR